MLFCDFHHKLRKLNKDLRIDDTREVTVSFKEFPTAGIYYQDNYLFACPHQIVPEWSIAYINERNEERLLWRGWKAILCNLINRNLITKSKAEKEFNTYLDPKLPKQKEIRYLNNKREYTDKEKYLKTNDPYNLDI